MPSVPTAATTIKRAKAGDLASIGRLYETHHLAVFRYLYYRVGDRQTAEDLTSEVFLRMVRSLAGYKDRGISFQAWLFKIAWNLTVDYFRKTSASPQLELSENLPASEAEPAAVVERRLTTEVLRWGLSRLSADQRDVVVLRFVADLPIADVARALNRSEDAVKGLQRRGLMALRTILEGSEAPYV
jgi:RNA polymerase sigma-70 factor (ECF subfamily)